MQQINKAAELGRLIVGILNKTDTSDKKYKSEDTIHDNGFNTMGSLTCIHKIVACHNETRYPQ